MVLIKLVIWLMYDLLYDLVSSMYFVKNKNDANSLTSIFFVIKQNGNVFLPVVPLYVTFGLLPHVSVSLYIT